MLPCVDFDAVRDALRREREARLGPRAKLEEASGITEGTIFKIETKWVDPRTKRAYVPSADQLLRLITALPGLTVAEFFAGIRGGGPTLSRAGSKVAPVATEGPADAPVSIHRAHLREIAVLKTRVKRYEIALSQVRDAAKQITNFATVRGEGRTSPRRRA